MKDPMEVLRFKEQEVQRVKKEIEALRLTARLLEEAGAASKTNGAQNPMQ